jgi:hypothetical protein
MNDTAATIAWCLHEALQRDLPAWVTEEREVAGHIHPKRSDRPEQMGANISVHAWPQAWPNTTLGMGGVGGQAFTTALTTVVVDEDMRNAAVYVGRHLRGVVEADHEFMARLAARTVINGRSPHGTAR